MPHHDLAAAEAALDALGRVPEDIPALVAAYAGALLGDLARVDAALDSLSEGGPSTFEAASSVQPLPSAPPAAARGPESGEVDLGAPVAEPQRVQAPPQHSDELPLAQVEHSGSFEVAGALPDDGAGDDPAAAMEQALGSQLPGTDLEDDEITQPGVEPSPSADEFETPDITQIVPTDARSDAPLPYVPDDEPPAEVTGAAQGEAGDDEFDALFEGLTRASDAPSPDDTDTALVTEERPILKSHGSGAPLGRGRPTEGGTSDASEVFGDAEELIEDLDLEELDPSELELVLDEDAEEGGEGGADDEPPPEDGGGKGRGGLLGRFLGRKK